MMSNEEEKRCPLCAEEMDWTDQQFKPCACGYQVCVWCWHHLIDVAEKDEMEGRCPACRSIYEKDKIVAMQENIERSSAKNTNKKTKQSKSKAKNDEGKKDLTNVRVIQRKMAYVIGLPLSLADEDVLVRKEYFGQYGKVTKISLSRTAGGAIQQFINDTCSVYITYSKQEEALRCIQSVHGFVLDGRYLRASFGTAKYCHAWLKNMPCNNTTCLYLHSIGADEDSFGKDEVAAVHTRGRVQQIVGSTNNALERSGNVLRPPEEDVCSIFSGVSEKSHLRSVISETPHGSVNSIGDITGNLPSKEKEGSVMVPHKATTFVDIVGRSATFTSGKDGDKFENKRIANLSSELSSIKITGDIPAGDSYSFPSLLKVSSSNSIGNEISKNFPNKPPREDSLRFDDQGSNDNLGLNQVAFSPFPNYPLTTSETSALLHESNRTTDDFSMEHRTVHDNHEDEASLPVRCVYSVLSNSFPDTNFQTSAKCDRIYRNSRSFSNEEIVEHLRRIDDDNLPSDEDKSALDVVERSIISNIMSIDFDLCEDSFEKPVFSDLLDETDGMHGSSRISLNSDLVGYTGFANPSIFPDCRDTEQYLCKPQYHASGGQILTPTGFTSPVKYPPPGFSTCDGTTSLSRPSSGNQSVNSNGMLEPSARAFSGNVINHFDPTTTMLGCADSKLKTRASSSPHLTTLDDEARLWLLMQQSAHQESRFSQMSVWPQHPSAATQKQSYDSHRHIGNGISEGNDTYGLCSRLVDQLQNYSASSFVQIPQQNQKYTNGHVSNTNGFRHSLDDVRHTGELASLEGYHRLGVNKYIPPPGYEDVKFSSDNLYSKLFRL